ncbi:type II methionyl aminopeptidase [Parachlamydia sp. AcF125]|uniref:type II methionyl aminopeptidase n=1 Tax=Parachlamydia sp. AcF125 TaxID=2795736 RepID=UPI001BCA1DED|nr:type II methionyl aminopeptidase [Parachlamydia sp. AcF125]MBS4168014.1 Methionine aminopeptidase [Parachlamydia sp. AcF125]
MNEKYKQDFIRAGKIANEVRDFGKSLIKVGASYQEVIAQIKQKILCLGALPAFPPQIALNHVAAHFLPQPDEDMTFGEDVVKLDVGVCYQGAIGDCAVTVDLSGKYQALIDAVENALLSAEQSIHVGLPVKEIGRIIEDKIASYGFKPVKNLAGHGLGLYKVHTAPMIPNYCDHSTAVVKAGMTFAIEPFATDGKGLIYDSGDPTIFSFVRARTVPLSIPRGVIAKIKSFNGLPFSMDDLIGGEYGPNEIRKICGDLIRAGVIMGHAPLLEEGQGMVAQAENSVMVDKTGKVFVTTR